MKTHLKFNRRKSSISVIYDKQSEPVIDFTNTEAFSSWLPDGEVIKPPEHRSYSSAVYYVAAFANLLGLFPIRNNFISKFKFKFRSWTVAYTALHFIIVTIGSLLVFRSYIMTYVNTRSFDDLAAGLVFTSSCLHGLAALLVAAFKTDDLPNLLLGIKRIEPLVYSEKSFDRWKRKSYVLIFSLTAINLTLQLHYCIQKILYKSSKSYYDVLESVGEATFFSYVFFVANLRLVLGKLNATVYEDAMTNLNEVLKRIADGKVIASSRNFLHLRIIYNHLMSLVQMFGENIGPNFFLYYVGMVIEISITTYLSIYEKTDSVYQMCWITRAVIYFLMMVLVATGNQRIYDQSLKPLKTLTTLTNESYSEDTKFQIQLFMSSLTIHIEHSKITGLNFFTVDKRLISTLTGVIISYVVIIIQFRLEDTKEDTTIFTHLNCT